MNMTILWSAAGLLATKRHCRDASGVINTDDYGKETWWLPEIAPPSNFGEMVDRLNRGLDEPPALAVRGAPKAGIDISRPIARKSNGPDATIEDVPQHFLHVDIDCIDEPHLDVVNRPDEARQHALGVIAKFAPELIGAACWMSWSSSAGVHDKTRVKLHVWYWLAQPYTCAQLKLWGKQVNARAGFKLVDLALFQSVQPNYIARPLFEGMDDPFPGGARAVVIEGRMPTLSIEARPPLLHAAATRIARGAVGGRGGSSSSSIEAAIASMGEGTGGFHGPWLTAMSRFYAQNGPDADPRPLILKLTRAIERHGTRDAAYVAAESRGMIRRARVLSAKERDRRASIDHLRTTFPTNATHKEK